MASADESYIHNHHASICILRRDQAIHMGHRVKPMLRKKSIDLHENIYCSAARCLLLTSLSSEMVSFVPLPLGSDIQGFVPSPITKMLEILIIEISTRSSTHKRPYRVAKVLSKES